MNEPTHMEKLAAANMVKEAVGARLIGGALRRMGQGLNLGKATGKAALGVGLPLGFGYWGFSGGRDNTKMHHQAVGQDMADAGMARMWGQLNPLQRGLFSMFPQAGAIKARGYLDRIAKPTTTPKTPAALG